MDERPATYREVFAVREYVHLFFANVLSVLGDQLAKVALAFLVYEQTNSEALSAAAFAASFVPWVIGGPLLSAYADRLPRRTVLIWCDLVRAALVALLVIPGMPVGALIGILFLANVFSPPFVSARAAMIPEVMEGDKYVVANGVDAITNQLGQVLGFAIGGTIVATLTAQGALVADVLTFLVSAVLIATGVRHRPAAKQTDEGLGLGTLLRDTAAGARYVFGNRRLRAYLMLFWFVSAFAYSVEGLAAPLADQFDGDARTGGFLLAAAPLGLALGGFVLGRLCPPALRIRLVLVLALLTCAILIPVWLAPPLPVLLVVLFLMGLASSFTIPLNPLFVRAVAPEYRGRAMGVAVSGNNVLQGSAIFLAGVIAETSLAPTTVVALSGAAGTLVVFALAPSWPHPTFRTRLSRRRAATDPAGAEPTTRVETG